MKKNNTLGSNLFCIIVLITILFSTFFNKAGAIPAFARKYKTACATCHIAITKRNAFGEAFRRNGYVMPEQNARLIKEPPVSLGAEAWKDAWPDAVWPGDLPSSVPLAAYAHMRFEYDVPASMKGHRTQFDMPNEFQLVMGGAFNESIGFFGEWVAFEDGVNAPGLERFFLQFNSVAGPKHAFNIRIGRFEPGITDGYISSQHLTLDNPLTLDYSATGDWNASDLQSGIELNGILGHRFQYALGLVNEDGKTVNTLSDQKDIYSRVAYKFHGMGLDGKRSAGDSLQTESNMDDSFTLGLFTYYGKAHKANTLGIKYNNNFNRYGIDAEFRLGHADFLSGIILGKDENPYADNRSLKSLVYFIESDYIFYPWLIGILRFEQVNSTFEGNDVDKYINIIPNLTVLVRLNVRLSIEGLINIQGDQIFNGQTIVADNHESFKWIKLNLLYAF